MTTKTEGIHTAEFLLSEGNGSISRAQITLAITATALAAGTVLTKNADGNYEPYADASAETKPASAVLYAPAPASAATQRAVAIVLQAEVIESLLTGFTETARTALAAVHIIAR